MVYFGYGIWYSSARECNKLSERTRLIDDNDPPALAEEK